MKTLLKRYSKRIPKFSKPSFSQSSKAYRDWRHKLMSRRIDLGLRFALPCTLSFLVQDIYFSQSLNIFKYPSIVADLSRAILISLCLMLNRSCWGHAHPKWMFILFSWSLALFPNLFSYVIGDTFYSPVAHLLTFLIQPVLIPFYWWLHSFVQGVAIAFQLFILHSYSDDLFWSQLDLTALFWLWFMLACSISVYIVEDLQRNDFESRRKLQGLLHAVGHDLRTPMMGSLMLLQRLLSKEQDKQVLVNASILEQIYQGTERQLLLLNSLMESLQARHVNRLLTRLPIRIHALVNEVLDDLGELLKSRNIQAETQFQIDLPEVEVDRQQMYRVFSNLITNVLNHNPPGTIVRITAHVKKQQVYCCVQDNGVGIPKDQHQQVFEQYSRGIHNRYAPGLGIGLSVCKHIIEAHEGEIGITNVKGGGTNVWFTLPLNQA